MRWREGLPRLFGVDAAAAELAFHSPLLELEATPLAPARSLLLYGVGSAVVAFVLWSLLGRLEMTVVATGHVAVAEGVKAVQSEETSVVAALRIVEGAHVAAGQELLALDPTAAETDLDAWGQKVRTLQGEVDRAHAELAGAAAPGLSPDERALLLAHRAAYETRRGAAESQLESRTQALESDRVQLTKLAYLRDTTQARAEKAAPAVDVGITQFDFSKLQEAATTVAADYAAQMHKLAGDEAEVAASRQSLAQIVADRDQQLATTIAEKDGSLAELRPDARKLEARLRRRLLVSPVDGYVQDLAVTTIGGVVSPAQVLMTIVPSGGEAIVEAQLNNEDVGHVAPGQSAQVRVTAFPAGRYGAVPATVLSVSRDTIADDRTREVSSANPATHVSAYRVRLKLTRNWLDGKGGRVDLRTGMSVSVAIDAGRRRVYEYLLAPFAEALDSAHAEF